MYASAPAAFRLIAGPQPPVLVPSPGVFLFILALTHVSQRLLGRLYAINGGSCRERCELTFPLIRIGRNIYVPYTLKPTKIHISILFAQDVINRYKTSYKIVTFNHCIFECASKIARSIHVR